MRNRPKLSQIRRCSKCRRFKPLEGFRNRRETLDGLSPQCRECESANSKRWREANPDKWREARGRWKAANPEKVRAIHRNTSHKRHRQKKSNLSTAALLAWEAAQRKVCHWCGAKCPSWHVDHRLPLAKGGEHELHNLVIACPTCNVRKGARDPIEFAQSLGKLL